VNYPATPDLELRFLYHPPASEDVRDLHAKVRAHCLDLARMLDFILPECRERSLAITHLEETMMWSNAAIARRISADATQL
jgi:hypothetical protein